MEIGVGALAPHISVGNHFKCRLVLPDRLFVVPDWHIHREIRADVEGRVNVDEIDAAFEFLEQAGHDEFVVAPDEPVPERFAAVAGAVFFHLGVDLAVKQLDLALRRGPLPGFIHGLDPLHRHRTRGHIHLAAVPVLVVLPFPHQFRAHL